MLMRVIDYKTGTKYFSPEKLAAGLDMQMLIYLFALEQNHAFGSAGPAGVLYLPSGQPKRGLYQERNKNTQPREAYFHDFYEMKGLLLEDTLPYMQTEASAPAPVMKHTQAAHLFSATQKQFSHLKQHVEKKICEMADRLYDGDTAPNPYLYQENSPCKYCPCVDICDHAEPNSSTLTAQMKQQALKAVFEDKEETENQNQEEEQNHGLD